MAHRTKNSEQIKNKTQNESELIFEQSKTKFLYSFSSYIKTRKFFSTIRKREKKTLMMSPATIMQNEKTTDFIIVNMAYCLMTYCTSKCLKGPKYRSIRKKTSS